MSDNDKKPKVSNGLVTGIKAGTETEVKEEEQAAEKSVTIPQPPTATQGTSTAQERHNALWYYNLANLEYSQHLVQIQAPPAPIPEPSKHFDALEFFRNLEKKERIRAPK